MHPLKQKSIWLVGEHRGADPRRSSDWVGAGIAAVPADAVGQQGSPHDAAIDLFAKSRSATAPDRRS